MKAIVLAGGLGTRLAPLTAAIPKPLVPVLNYPIIGHVLATLRRAGITDIGVTVKPHADQLVRYFGTGHHLGINVTWLHDATVIGTGGTLRDHAAYFEDKAALVVTADMLSDVDLVATIRHHHTHRATVTVAAHPVDLTTWPGDTLYADGAHGLAYQFKPGPDRALSNLGSAGIWVVDPTILDALPPHGHVDFSADVLPTHPHSRHTLAVYNNGPTRLRDFGQFETYHQGNLEALDGHHDIAPAGTLAAPHSWVEAGCRIHPAATLTGPVAIGRAVTIGPHARITGPTVIGHGAHIGTRAAIARSVILPGATVTDDTLTANAVHGTPAQVFPSLMAHR